MLATAKSAKKPKMTPKTQPTKVTVKSSVIKYPATRLFGHPAALINPKSLVSCAIIKKTMKDVRTAPTTKIKNPMKKMNWLKIAVKPSVKVPMLKLFLTLNDC
jgi:DNA polymerase sigma